MCDLWTVLVTSNQIPHFIALVRGKKKTLELAHFSPVIQHTVCRSGSIYIMALGHFSIITRLLSLLQVIGLLSVALCKW